MASKPGFACDSEHIGPVCSKNCLRPWNCLRIIRGRKTLTYNGARQTITIDADFVLSRLRKAGAEQRCSLFMTLLSGFSILLHRLSGQDDVVVGVPFDSAVRELEGGKNLFTNTTNVLPLRSRISDQTKVTDYWASDQKSRCLRLPITRNISSGD